MRKKYLSALLFGALLFASAGTFTSCKDYDDDISNLQGQVDGIKADLEDLQAQISAGKWIQSVTPVEGGFTVTISDGQSFTIVNGQDGAAGATGAAGAPGTQITIGEDGYWYFDGEKSEYKAVVDAEEGKVNVPTIKDGVWYIVNEDGELEATEYKANGATYAVAEANGGFTIYAPNADGTGVVECYFPGAAGSITEMTLGEKTKQARTSYTMSGSNVLFDYNDVLVSRQVFNFNGNGIINSASAWMGNKELPADGEYVYSSPTRIDLRIDPVNVPANGIEFTLTDTKNSNLTPFKFAARASQDSNNDPMSNTNSRAAVTGNGLWTLSMENVVVSEPTNGVWNYLNTAATQGYLYAVNADNAFRSEYNLNVKRVDPEQLTQLSIRGVNTSTGAPATYTTTGVSGDDYDTGSISYKTGVAYKVNGVQSSALYDMYLTADASDIEVYGLTFNQDNHTFTIGKNPDVSSIPAHFTLEVYTVSNAGEVNKATIEVQINSAIHAPAEYTLIEHDVNTSYENNYFGIDLAIMKTALGDNLNQWIQNVDLRDVAVDMKWSYDGGKTFGAIPAGIQANVVSELLNKYNPKYNPNADDDRNAANFIQVDIDNSAVSGLLLDYTYYIKATFRATTASGAGELNSITVPVQFHAPALSELFAVRDAYVVDDVINAYFYDTATNSTAVDLNRYFSKYVCDADLEFTNDNIGETGHNGAWWFKFSDATAFGKSTIDFRTDFAGEEHRSILGGKGVNAYGEAVKVNVKKAYFNTDETASAGWNYTLPGSDTYSFQIRLMSPIYEGTVTPVSGDVVKINANDFVHGAKLTSEHIVGRDYATNDFYMFQGNLTTGWRNKQIVKVVPDVDTEHYIESAKYDNVYDKEGKLQQAGVITIKGRAISNTTTVHMPIKIHDAWGLVLSTSVPVQITVGEE